MKIPVMRVPRLSTEPDSGCICESLRAVLRDRERELFELKGACSNKSCRLHYAHSGPCDCR